MVYEIHVHRSFAGARAPELIAVVGFDGGRIVAADEEIGRWLQTVLEGLRARRPLPDEDEELRQFLTAFCEAASGPHVRCTLQIPRLPA